MRNFFHVHACLASPSIIAGVFLLFSGCMKFQMSWKSTRASCNLASILMNPFPFLTSRDRWFRSIAVQVFDVVRLDPFLKRVSYFDSFFFVYMFTVLSYLHYLPVIKFSEELGVRTGNRRCRPSRRRLSHPQDRLLPVLCLCMSFASTRQY